MLVSNLRQLCLSLIFFLLVVTSFSFFYPFIATAQTGSAGVGIEPAVIDPPEQFKPGETRGFQTKIKNLSGIDQTYFISKRDIVGVREGGVPIFSEFGQEATGYELSDWISLSNEEVFVPAGASIDYNFTMSIPSNAVPGSHFGSIIVAVDPPDMDANGASIGYEVANIISIRVEGEVSESARIRQFSTSQYIYGSTNVSFEAVIENEGNTLVKPLGPLEVKNMYGKKVASLTFNESQSAIFPKTTRSFKVDWTDETPGFGRYEALLSAVYGVEGSMKTMTSTVTFWVLPMNIILPSIIGLLVLLLVIYVAVKIYVRRSLALVSSVGVGRRLVRARKQGQFPVFLVFISMLAVTALFFIVLLLLFA